MVFSTTRRTVLPSTVLASPSKTQFCLICLDTSEECKLYPVNKYNMHMEFEYLTGITLKGVSNFVPQFCAMCTQTLINCRKFRFKCQKVYHLLLAMLRMNQLPTTQNINMLRTSNNLTSSIGKKSFGPDHCDLHLIHKEEEIPNNKTMKIEIVDGKLVLYPDPVNETNVEIEVENAAAIDELNTKIKTEKLDDISDVEYLDDYTDIDIGTDLKRDVGVEEFEDADINGPQRQKLDDLTSDIEWLEDDDVDIDLKLHEKDKGIKNVVEKTETKELNDLSSDTEYLEDVDDIVFSDTESVKRVKGKVDKFTNEVNNDTDKNWDSLKDNDSSLGAVNSNVITKKVASSTNADGKIKGTKQILLKPRNKRKRKIRKTEPVKGKDLEYLNNYKITELTHEDQVADVKKRKKTVNFKNSPYKCMKCFKVFRSVDIYNTHKEKHTY